MATLQKTEMVSSADIVRNFGLWQDRATHAPVVVTNRGRPRYVLLSFDQWRTSKPETVVPAAPATERDAEYKALVERMAGGFVILDHMLAVREMSTAAAVLIGCPADAARGMPIAPLLDRVGIGIAVSEIRGVLQSGEDTRFDLPLPGGQLRRLRGHAYPWVNGVALSLTPYYETRADVWLSEQRALEKARNEHRGVFVLRLSVRGTVSMVDDKSVALIGLTRERILQARFVDLLALSARARARDAIEAVLSGAADAMAFDSAILTNGGEECCAAISLAPIADGFAIGGAMVLLTVTTTV